MWQHHLLEACDFDRLRHVSLPCDNQTIFAPFYSARLTKTFPRAHGNIWRVRKVRENVRFEAYPGDFPRRLETKCDEGKKQLIIHNHHDDGVDRRGFLKCMAWAGTGALYVLKGGIVKSYSLSDPAGLAAGAANSGELRTALAMWWLVLLLGTATYVRWYVAPLLFK